MTETPQTITIARTVPGVILDETAEGTAVLVEPGTYAVDEIDQDEQLVTLDVPAVEDWYVGIHTDHLGTSATLPVRPKVAR